ncbi:MAG TPA: TetR/AcrR family transcriptional regulator [Acidimicrobiales bacterium]|nr:TetR/AcrR family transcriptional regulator [Acidimicrobiales bacterium]
MPVDTTAPAPRVRRREDVHTRLLDAAESCFHQLGITQTTMDDVIRAARVPRTTAYRYVGTKNDLIAAVVYREWTRFLERLDKRLAKMRDVEDALVEGLMLSIDECRNSEIMAAAFGIEDIVAVHTSTAPHQDEWFQSFVEFMSQRLAPARKAGLIRSDITDADITEWAMRTIVSFAAMGDVQQRGRAERREHLRRMFLPAILSGR